MTDTLQFNRDDARRLFETIIYPIHLVAIEPDAAKGVQPHGQNFGADIEAALDWAERYNAAGHNVYWTANYVADDCQVKPTKALITAARLAHVDLDPPKDGAAWDKAAEIVKVRQHAAPPSLIVTSGNGLQPLWLLDAPEDGKDAVEAVNRGLAAQFGGDNCHNIDRLLRVPGTINYPNETKRKRGSVACMAGWVQEDTSRRYSMAELTLAFPAPPAPPRERTAVSLPDDWRPLCADDLGLAADSRLRQLIEHPKGDDRSKDMYAAAARMATEQRTVGEMFGVLLNPDNPVSAHALDQGDPERAASRAIAAALIEHPPLVGLPAMPHGEVPSPPLTDEQLAVKRGQAELGDVYWSESGIATTLADAMIDQLRIAPALSDKAWFVTDAERGGWMRDDANRVMGMCHIAGQVRAKEAMAQAQTSGVTRTLASLRTAKAVAGLMALDRRLIVAPDAFDADPWLLGTPGAVVDLRTGEARGYRPEDMVSKHTAVRPADSADCPTWMDFLDTTFGGDADLIRYFQRWAGYALTGVIGDPTILVATGKGSNGKSVAFNVITGLLGDYAINADERLFKADGSSDHPAALARLQGARLVLAAEFPEARVNVDRIQRISGGDVVTARGMGEGFFDFHPQCKLAFTSNFTIQLGRVNEAIRRRIRQLPFDHTVPPDRRIVNYDKKLLEAEGPGIIRWAIDGCLAFQRDGGKLGTCAAIERATDAYFTAQDPVKRWLDENVTGLPDGWEQTTTLQADYARWAAENGERVITPKALSIELEGRGLHRHKKAAGMGFSGIALSRHPLGNVVPLRPAG